MRVKIENSFEEFLREHHYNTITLELASCNEPHDKELILSKPIAEEPRVIFSKPVNESHFQKHVVDDITVYVAKDIKAEDDELEIMDQRVGGMDTCHVRGWAGYSS